MESYKPAPNGLTNKPYALEIWTDKMHASEGPRPAMSIPKWAYYFRKTKTAR